MAQLSRVRVLRRLRSAVRHLFGEIGEEHRSQPVVVMLRIFPTKLAAVSLIASLPDLALSRSYRNDRPDRGIVERAVAPGTPRSKQGSEDTATRRSGAPSLRSRAGCRRHRLAARIYPTCLLRRCHRTADRMAAGEPVSSSRSEFMTEPGAASGSSLFGLAAASG